MSDKEKDSTQFDRDAAFDLKESSSSTIPEDEIESYMIANIVILFMAGFDTSSTALTVATWFLAKNQV